MGIRFSDLSTETQEEFVENLMEIKSESERIVVEIVKGTNIELLPTIKFLKEHLQKLEAFLSI